MSWILVVLGLACVALVIVDLLWTTVAAGAGGGPLTGRLGDLLWSLTPRGTSPGRHRLLQVAGVAITAVMIAVWIGLLLLGWLLVFSSFPDAVVASLSREPADLWARVYYTVFTLGTGDYVPGGPVWQMATVAGSGAGLTLVTLAITYVLSVTTAVTERRQLAAQITALGSDPVDVLSRAWNGSELTALSSPLQSLVSQLTQLAQRHLAFPVLHYFHSVERQTAVAPSVAMLDELLTVLEHGIAPSHRLPDLTTAQLREAISSLLERTTSMPDSGAPREAGELPMPALVDLEDLGIPVVSPETWQEAIAQHGERRRRLGELLAVDGWPWDSVWPSGR